MTRSILLAMLAACGTTPASNTDFDVTWEPRDPVQCTDVISHPCPFITYTKHMAVTDDGHLVWDDATGGTDEAGVTAENRAPWIDDLVRDDFGGFTLAERGDDGGLRYQATIVHGHTSDGRWEGLVTWALFNRAGTTNFLVTLRSR